MSHTILLIQANNNGATRAYSDYESLGDCIQSICKIYEEYLKRKNPQHATITYDISQLFHFLDQLHDITCLVYEASSNMYAPYSKDWIKQRLYILLMEAATQSTQ